MKILIVEPQCIKHQHVPINSAIILRNLDRKDVKTIYLICERNHFLLIKDQLEVHERWHSVLYLEIRQQEVENKISIRDYIKNEKQINQLINSQGIAEVIYLSCTRLRFILMLVEACVKEGANKKVYIHAMLGDLVRYFGKNLFMKFAFKLMIGRKYSNVEMIVYSESILDELKRKFKLKKIFLKHENHWYIKHKNKSSKASKEFQLKIDEILSNKKTTLGFLGASRGAIARFVDEKSFFDTFSNYNNLLVGWMDKLQAEKARCLLQYVSEEPLEIEEYNYILKSVDYIIILSDPERYRYSVSGAFIDCIKYEKPVIYLKNPYIESLERKYGPFGWGFDNVDAIVDFVKSMDTIMINKIEHTRSLKRIRKEYELCIKLT